MTNFVRIKQMTAEELANSDILGICEERSPFECAEYLDGAGCKQCTLDWLREEARAE